MTPAPVPARQLPYILMLDHNLGQAHEELADALSDYEHHLGAGFSPSRFSLITPDGRELSATTLYELDLDKWV